MSIQNVADFVAKLVNDQELMSKVDWSNPQGIVDLGRQAGFDFTTNDLANAPPPDGGLMELTDSDLDSVAGAGQALWSLFGCKDKEPETPDGPDGGGDGPGKGGGGTEITTTHSTGCPVDTDTILFCGGKPEGPLPRF